MRARAERLVEPLHILAIRAGLYALSLILYLLPLTSGSGLAAATVMAIGGLHLGALAYRRGVRTPVVVVAALPAIFLSLALGEWLLEVRWLAQVLGIRALLLIGECLGLGLGALCTGFLLRFLAQKARSLSLLEVLFVAGSVVVLLADHRNRMLNRPRFFADWAWSLGLSPALVLAAVGVLATLVAILLFLRDQTLGKLLLSALLLLLLASAFYLLWDKRMEEASSADALGISGRGKGAGGSNESNDPFKNDYSTSSPPKPVAVAILRDDLPIRTDMLYFRQAVLSSYNGHHLVSGMAQGWDSDVIAGFPRSGSIEARSAQSAEDHIDLPSTVYLLVDHPQPIGLTHPLRITAVPNPNPQQFVAAYDVLSRLLAVEPYRLLGRASIPESWSPEQRRHYTELPADPRYRALSDLVVKDVDPRFAGDDIAKAFAIKRYLEREGFYSLKSSHRSDRDPTASFLFGSLRGYCVHFAHAAVYLLRSQGLAARVALGYAVQISQRGGGSALLIMSDRAHAWPELHLAGIGWVTFDIHPEQTDLPPPTPVDYDLEKLLGELARRDPTAGFSPSGQGLHIPWAALLRVCGALLASLLVLAYLIKLYRRIVPRFSHGPAYFRRTYIAVLDLLADLGASRQRGETRERHAERLRALAPNLVPLTRLHLALALGSQRVTFERPAFAHLVAETKREIRVNVHLARRLCGLLNPIGWLWTR